MTGRPPPPVSADPEADTLTSDHRKSWADFTEAGFRALLESLAVGSYKSVRYGEPLADRVAVLRHDVDVSMHRAAALARIEAKAGVRATYFLHPRCGFYSLAEPPIAALARAIAALGHDIGLHFDAGSDRRWTRDGLEAAVRRDRALLEAMVERPAVAVSWHNPGFSNALEFKDARFGGLVNAYGRHYWDSYSYCSDSNGYWRHQPMPEVVAAGHPRLHLLIHPEWWTPTAMSPSARMDRAVEGRNRAMAAQRPDRPRPPGYDAAMASALAAGTPEIIGDV